MKRPLYLQKVDQLFAVHPIVGILGARQCGKTTLSQMYAGDRADVTVFDLENSRDLAKLDNPMLALESLKGLIIIDEIQKRPDLFPVLRVLIDKFKGQQTYLILGSASRELIRQSSETLAGRIGYLELSPFSLLEAKDAKRLWIRGGFPLSYLADDIQLSAVWRKSFIKTFLEQDIPNLGFHIPPHALRRFWMMLAHYHGNVLNASEIGRSLGISDTTVKRYLDILSGTFMMRQLPAWFENIKKRQVKSPKIYFRDSGIFHSLLGVTEADNLRNHPKCGASWEGFALEEVIRFHGVDAEDCYFWGTHAGAELDLLIIKNNKRLGFEFKYSDAPRLTKSMKIAYETLKLDHLTLIMPGTDNFPLGRDDIRAIGLESYLA